MRDPQVGAVFRAVRQRRGFRQQDVAARAGVSHAQISLVERGHIGSLTLNAMRQIAGPLEITLDLSARWRGADVDRLLNAGHARMHEDIARLLNGVGGWVHHPEISFAIYGERGVIDILAHHTATSSLLIVELKTELASIEDLLDTMGRRRRLARTICRDLGWEVATVSTWVVVAESDASRRRVREHAATLRSAFPDDGRRVRAWLRRPHGEISALSFWANARGRSSTERVAARKRVRVHGNALIR